MKRGFVCQNNDKVGKITHHEDKLTCLFTYTVDILYQTVACELVIIAYGFDKMALQRAISPNNIFFSLMVVSVSRF